MAEAMAPEERDLLAAELALGLLVEDERAFALRMRLSDPEFAQAVDWWEQRFAPLNRITPDVVPPELWPAIEKRLGVAGAPAASDEAIVVSLANRMIAWRIGALATGAIAAGLAIMLVTRTPTIVEVPVAAPAAQTIVAQLGESGGAAQLVANYDPDKAQLRIRAVAIPVSELVPELWVIPAGGAPLSLGLVAAKGSTEIAVPEALRQALKDGATLAVTLEKSEGAPHMAPSSTPIAVGTMHKI
jgi:anti-sigma-K factor RskA